MDRRHAPAAAGGAAVMPNPTSLPDGLEPYRRTELFSEASVPAALRRDHCTKVGSWGLIRITAGRLRYRITDPRRPATDVLLTADDACGIVEPTILHHVEPDGPVSFHVEFLRCRGPGGSPPA